LTLPRLLLFPTEITKLSLVSHIKLGEPMQSRHIKYKAGYKYQLREDYFHLLPPVLAPLEDILHDYISIDPMGKMVLSKGYAWDGPSGPTVDTKSFLRASAVHDALYQLMELGIYPRYLRKEMDRELIRICKKDGMNALRRCWVYQGVRQGYRLPFVKKSGSNPVQQAP